MSNQRRGDLILHRAERALADEHGCTLDEMLTILDQHPLETNRDQFLRRMLAMQLLVLDEIQTVFRQKALAGDTASGALLVKIAERVATLLGLNAPIGHAVRVVQHPPVNQPTATDRIEKVINDLLEQDAKTSH